MIKHNVSLKEYTTFNIGGKAKYFIEAETEDELKQAIKQAQQKNTPFFILGGGSNLLISDNGFNGIVIKMKNNGHFKIERSAQIKTEFEIIKVGAGAKLGAIVELCLENGLSGMEWAAGIPRAEIGGAVYGNAGAFGQNIAERVEQVEVLDANTLETKTLQFEDCVFDYKETIFKKNKNLIILSVVLKLDRTDKAQVKQEVKRVLEYRAKSHPAKPSPGCIFKNPRQAPAAQLIEKCGLKGKKIGGAMISNSHANFIVNTGKATAKDVKKLIMLAKKQVKEKFKINLEEEIQYL